MASEPVCARPVGTYPRTMWVTPQPHWEQMVPQSATKQGPVFLNQVPSGHSLAWPPRTSLATGLLVCCHCPGGTRWQAVGRGLRTLGSPNEDRTSSWCLAPEGQAEPKPTSAETGPGGSEQREGARRPAAAARGWAGRRWQRRPVA